MCEGAVAGRGLLLGRKEMQRRNGESRGERGVQRGWEGQQAKEVEAREQGHSQQLGQAGVFLRCQAVPGGRGELTLPGTGIRARKGWGFPVPPAGERPGCITPDLLSQLEQEVH